MGGVGQELSGYRRMEAQPWPAYPRVDRRSGNRGVYRWGGSLPSVAGLCRLGRAVLFVCAEGVPSQSPSTRREGRGRVERHLRVRLRERDVPAFVIPIGASGAYASCEEDVG